MSITQIERCRESQSHAPQRIIARFATTGRMMAMGAGLAAMTLAAVPVTARAKDGNAGAAVGLGILGGVIAGAAIASTAPPVYAAPPVYYPYPRPSYYYSLPPTYYYSPYPYSASAGYSYPPYDYR